MTRREEWPFLSKQFWPWLNHIDLDGQEQQAKFVESFADRILAAWRLKNGVSYGWE